MKRNLKSMRKFLCNEQTDKIDFEDPYSSESEYIPDTESEKSEEKGDVIKKLNQNMKPSCSLIGPDFEQPHSSESEYILDTESEESEEEGEAIKKLNQNIRPSCSSGPSTSSGSIPHNAKRCNFQSDNERCTGLLLRRRLIEKNINEHKLKM
ncbi:hypothetical protein NQ318_003250 [Aromia moschata]|uniref:Uncharacterized protein n=1 Tax=Aromia moschata TaxID=1265417 RepID=A0AAV8XPR3_9CUCU|nr:hypothetical protein NQ318_003250 [Aromia moschata]